MKTLYFTLILVVSFTTGYSQAYNQATKNVNRVASQDDILNANDDGLTFFNSYLIEQGNPAILKELKGSIYLNREFQVGKISDALYEKRQFTYLRYNIYADAFEIKNALEENERVYAVIKKKDVSVKIGDKTFFLRSFKNKKGNPIDGYLEVLKVYDGFTVYKRYSQTFTMAVPAPNPNAFGKPAEVKTFTEYYIEEDGRYYFVNMSKRKITDTFFKNPKDLEKFIKSKRLKFKKEADLITLTDFYATQN